METKEKTLVITTNVKIDIKNEVELETDLLKLNQTKAIQHFWVKKKKWITFWMVIRWFVSLLLLFYGEKQFNHFLVNSLEMVSVLAYILIGLSFIIAIVGLVLIEFNCIKKDIDDYPAKLTPVLEIYRQNLLTPFLDLRRNLFTDLITLIFPSVDQSDIERNLDRGENVYDVIFITGCTYCLFDHLIIKEHLGKGEPLFQYNWYVKMDMFLQKDISLTEITLDENRNVILVLKGDGLQDLVLKQESMIKSKAYTEVW